MNRPVSSWAWVSVVLVLSMLVGFLASLDYAQYHNVLYENGQWISSKAKLRYPTIGAVSYLFLRDPLIHNQLNLSSDQGLHEVLYCRPGTLRDLSFDCCLPLGNYLSFVFDKGGPTYRGVRLSRRSSSPNLFFQASAAGQFLSKTALQPALLERERSHASIIFEGGKMRVAVDGQPLGTYECPPGKGYFGFKGSLKYSTVDNINFHTDRLAVSERFDRMGSALALSPVSVLACAILSLTLLCLLSGARWHGPLVVSYNLCAIVVLAVLYLVEWHGLRGNYPSDPNVIPLRHPIHSQQDAADQVVRDIAKRYPTPSSVPRILFLGGSQTWGEGAAAPEDRWVRRLEVRLNAEHGAVECINGGVRGGESPQLLKLYRDKWIDLGHRLLVMDLGHNDGDIGALIHNVKEMASLSAQRRIPCLLVLEPTSAEYVDHKLEVRRDALENAAHHMSLPCVNMHQYLLTCQDDGFLFWDRVHLTSFGQQAFADRLYADIVRFL